MSVSSRGGCSFNNNTAKYAGGSVRWWGDNGFLSDCSFNNNHAKYDGAVLWFSANGVLSGCSFNNNTALFGGAICWDGNNSFLSGCSFVIFRSKNTSFVNIPNLIYYNGKDYDAESGIGGKFVFNFYNHEEDIIGESPVFWR